MTRLKAILKQYTKDKVVLSETADSMTIDSDSPLGYTTITCNIFGDIVDISTGIKEIIAVSDIPHDLYEVDEQMPSEWYYVKDDGKRPKLVIKADGTHYIRRR